MKNAGYIIKKMREDKNISQEELAHELNISQGKLSKIENGRLKPSLYFLVAVFNFFSLTISDLAEFLQNFQI
ncbi:helix-turn-helix domain-containing protein [Chryseobacterium sp.]|jgi:transcriptional regulator with XRE-family HTH domain|uniref:helix-turn-helix domain-containing protein n=1 Tax=Chryseobacterium sp. TaxID=1871047 RepID=UPI0011CA5E37|nr:helix-turn-helix transcriptional regulator [Chryseobacterium sp.]TXF78823.1 helix-turn-helix transcriptional regulator [Chryseobacterium sp.]